MYLSFALIKLYFGKLFSRLHVSVKKYYFFRVQQLGRNIYALTPEALEKLQRDTLGGAVWTDVGPDLAEYVSYDESRDLYTVRPGRPQSLGAYIESAAYREDAACAELTVVVYDAEKSDLNSAVAGRYLIDLRAVEGSEYGYIIAAFSTAE